MLVVDFLERTFRNSHLRPCNPGPLHFTCGLPNMQRGPVSLSGIRYPLVLMNSARCQEHIQWEPDEWIVCENSLSVK